MGKLGSRAFWKVSGGLAGLLLLLAMLFAVNVILSGIRLRADLTQEKLYTLSPGTKSLVGKLDRPVTLKFFFNSSSPEVPMYLKNYAKQVEAAQTPVEPTPPSTPAEPPQPAGEDDPAPEL